MTHAELIEWVAFNRIEPFGERHRDLTLALIATTVANSVPRKGSTPFMPGDIFPWLKVEDPEADAKARSAAIDRLLFGG